MKKYRLLIILLAIIAVFYFARTVRSFTVQHENQTIKSEHFIVSYNGIYKDEAEKVSKHLEENYSKIRENLKDVEHDLIKVFCLRIAIQVYECYGFKRKSKRHKSRPERISFYLYQLV